MRRIRENNGIRVKAYSGTTGILLAFNIHPEKRKGLLGFAISRQILTGKYAGRIGWLQGMLDFKGTSKRKGELIATNVAPIQKFRWSDYAVYPGTSYAYSIYPVYKRTRSRVTAFNRRLYLEEGPRVEVTTQDFNGENAIIFNRAVAASQAFSRRFPNLNEEIEAARRAGTLGNKSLPQKALNWLSRGMVEQIEHFIDSAKDRTWGIDLAIYEYHLERLHKALVAAGKRGVRVRVLYHKKRNDPASKENEELLHNPPIPGAELFARKTTAIMHNKFAVLKKEDANGEMQPLRVLAGSTNWTENGCYRQANVVHITSAPSILERYTNLFEALVTTRDSRRKTKNWIEKHNPFPNAPERFAGFSPRKGLDDINKMAALIGKAKRDVLFSTAFSLHDQIENALLGQPHDKVLRMGIQNRRSNVLTGIHRDRTAQFTAAALLPGGLEGWLKETTAGQRGNIRIHTKAIVVDVTSDSPLVISGSHNYSTNASSKNDENYLIVRRDLDVADVYLCEIMRIYDHYRFRYSAKERRAPGRPFSPPALAGDDNWTNPYFVKNSLKELDRKRFAGEMGE